MPAETQQIVDIIPAQHSGGTLGHHPLDDETKALLGYLARYHGKTLTNYEIDLRQFKTWTLDFGLKSMLQAERYQLELYVRYMQDRGLATSTINRRFGTVRGFYHFAHVDGLILKDPAAYVATPRVRHDQQYRTWFESVDMAIVLRRATDPLDRAVLQLMFDLALRVGELCALNVDSMTPTNAGTLLRFIGKGNKLAEMVIPAASMAALDSYLATRPDPAPGAPLFLNHYGNRLTRANVQRILDRLTTDAGVGYRVTPHGIRRTSCRFGIQQGESIEDAADRLRHSDSRVTKLCYAVDTGVADIKRAKMSALMANLSAAGRPASRR